MMPSRQTPPSSEAPLWRHAADTARGALSTMATSTAIEPWSNRRGASPSSLTPKVGVHATGGEVALTGQAEWHRRGVRQRRARRRFPTRPG